MCPDKLHLSLFLDRFPRYTHRAAESAHSNFIGSGLYACLSVTCHLHFGQNELGLLCATAVTGVEWTPNKSQHTKLTLEKKILPPLLPGFEFATFQSQVHHFTNKLSQLPKPIHFFLKVGRSHIRLNSTNDYGGVSKAEQNPLRKELGRVI